MPPNCPQKPQREPRVCEGSRQASSQGRSGFEPLYAEEAEKVRASGQLRRVLLTRKEWTGERFRRALSDDEEAVKRVMLRIIAKNRQSHFYSLERSGSTWVESYGDERASSEDVES